VKIKCVKSTVSVPHFHLRQIKYGISAPIKKNTNMAKIYKKKLELCTREFESIWPLLLTFPSAQCSWLLHMQTVLFTLQLLL